MKQTWKQIILSYCGNSTKRRLIVFITHLRNFTVAPVRFGAVVCGYIRFKRQCRNPRFRMKFSDLYPCLYDNTATLGFDPHYTYHPAWAARILADTKPEKHIDISSAKNFVAVLSAFIPTEYYEFRPCGLNLSGLTSGQGDLNALPFADNSVASLSCMHVIEHIGLGRYGDPLDYDGDKKAAAELVRVMRQSGDLLIVLPIADTPCICFNAHRIYSYRQVLEMFDSCELIQFSLIRGMQYIHNAKEADTAGSCYDCGCFHFRKK